MTQDNFETILSRLNEIQTKNDADHALVGQRLDSIDARLSVVDARLGGVDQRLGGVDQRLAGVERGLQEVRHLIDADDIEKRLST